MFAQKTPSDAGNLYLKIPAKVYANTVQIESFWSNALYGIPECLGVSPGSGAGLCKDMKGSDAHEGAPCALTHIAESWGRMQQKITMENHSYTKSLRLLPDYTPQKLASSLHCFIEQISRLALYDSESFTPAKINKVRRALARVAQLLDLLSAFCIPNTLCHGDIRPGNIRKIDKGHFLYDWGMSFYAHPFYDMTHLLHVVRKRISAAEKENMIKTYLEQWLIGAFQGDYIISKVFLRD